MSAIRISPRQLPDLSSQWALILVTALLLGTFLVYSYDLAHTPPEVPSDATEMLADGMRISGGIPFPADFGTSPEPAFRYVIGGWFALTGLYVYTARLVPVMLSLLTVALTYQAARRLLWQRAWNRVGALIAAASIAASTPFLILGRDLYRASLLPPLVALTAIMLLTAVRSTQPWRWAVTGFLAGLAMHTYLAGLMSIPWAVGMMGHQLLTRPAGKRLCWRAVIYFAAGLLPPVAAWLTLFALVPNLFSRYISVGMVTPFSWQVLDGIWQAIQAYIRVGYPLPTFNTPNTPFLNPPLAILAIIGLGLALRNWRRPEGALILGGAFLFTLPGALTPNPTYSIRLFGTIVILGLMVGWGTTWVMSALMDLPGAVRRLAAIRPMAKPLLMASTVLLIVLSMIGTHVAYHGMFNDPANYANPRDWLSIPHNFSMAFQESMQILEKVDQPTYVPMWMLNNPAAAFFLQRKAFPNVTTWARYGLKELPEGQFFFPVYWYYHMTTVDESMQRVLLLPRDKTIVLLPGSGLPRSISGPPPQAGDQRITEIKNDRGWTLVRLRPVPRSELAADWPPPVSPDDPAPVIGSGLRLLTRHPIAPIEPGKPAVVLLEWLVTAPQPADLFSVVQLVNQDFVSMPGGTDQHVLFYLYPSARWQPGDIIPDWHLVNIPADLPPGIYRWGAGAYVPPSRKRLSVTAPGGVDAGPQLSDLWLWDAIRVPTPQPGGVLPADATRLNARLGNQIALEGYRLAPNGRQWDLTLYWHAQSRPLGDYTIFIHAQRGDNLVAQHDEKPLGGKLPTWAWLPGELVTTTYTLELPAAAPEPDAVYVGMYSYPSLERLPAVQDGTPSEDRRIVLWSQGK